MRVHDATLNWVSLSDLELAIDLQVNLVDGHAGHTRHFERLSDFELLDCLAPALVLGAPFSVVLA